MAVMTRRQYLGGGAALGAGLLAAACDVLDRGGEIVPDATQETRPAIAKPPGVPNQTKQSVAVQVRLAPIGSYGGNTPGKRLTAPFTETHPHITVEWYHLQFEEVAEASATAGLQDVLHFPWAEGVLWQGYVARLVTQGMLLGLNQFIRRDRYDLTDYWPGCLHASTWRGDLYALHTEVDTNLVFYNQELFAAARVPVPTGSWTWDELLRYAHTLTQPQGVYGFGLFTGYFFTIPWIWSNGGAVISADQTRSLVDQPQSQAALQWLAELRHAHAVWPPSGPPTSRTASRMGSWRCCTPCMATTRIGCAICSIRGLLSPMAWPCRPFRPRRRQTGSGWRLPSSWRRRLRCRMSPGPSSVGGRGRPLSVRTNMASPVKSGSGCFLSPSHRRGGRWRRS